MGLRDFNFHHFNNFINEQKIEILDDSYLGRLLSCNQDKGALGGKYANLLNISTAVENILEKNTQKEWLIHNLHLLSTKPYKTNEEKIYLNSKVAAELVAGGLLIHAFNSLNPLSEINGQKNPDFQIDDQTFVEVYCPQTSQQNIQDVQEQRNRQKDKNVSIVFSRPLTGQAENAKKYPANKIIDRILNHKRSNDQTKTNAINLLWLDLTHGFDVDCSDTQPLKTIHHVGTIYTGSFGVWHAFYGRKDNSKFAHDRTDLQYPNWIRGCYLQMTEGLFRQRNNLHGALLLTKDGLIFFENPWSSTPLPENIKKKLTQLYRFRADFSWFQFGKTQMQADVVENELQKINWLYNKTNN